VISDKFNFIFFHVPKAAGSSVTKGFSKSIPNDVKVNENNVDLKSFLNKKGKLWPNHATCHEVKTFLREDGYNSYFKFCFVRNPWDRLVSLYHYTVQKEAKIYAEKGVKLSQFNQQIINAGSFDNWVKTGNLGASQFQFLSDTNGKLLVDFVGRSENLQADFSYVCGLLGMPNIILPKVNVSKHKKYQEYYSDETKHIAAKRFAKDIELFGYTFDDSNAEKMLNVNNIFLEKIHQSFIKVISTKNKNKYCRFTREKISSKDNIHLHTSNVNEPDFEIEFLLIGSSKKPISSLEFFCNAFNNNLDNPGVIIDYQIINNKKQQLAAHKIQLKPRTREKVSITFRPQEKCFLKLKVLNVPEAASNKYCGVRLNNFKLN